MSETPLTKATALPLVSHGSLHVGLSRYMLLAQVTNSAGGPVPATGLSTWGHDCIFHVYLCIYTCP